MKRKNKQFSCAALAAAMALGCLTGCVPQKTSSPAPETTAPVAAKETEEDKPLMNPTGMPIVNALMRWQQNPVIIKILLILSFSRNWKKKREFISIGI